MTMTVTAEQVGSVVVLEWSSTDGDPVAGFGITRDINPVNAPELIATIAGDNYLYYDQLTEGEVAEGDILEYVVEDLDTTTTGNAQAIYATADRWTTIADVRRMLGTEASFADEEINAAIEAATARLESVFCTTVTVDGTTGLPTDPNVQSATTVMASRILIQPASGVPPVQGGQITSERLGSYSYSIRPGTGPTSTGPQTVDSVIKELVGGYLCPGYAGIPIQTDIYPYDAAEDLADISTGVTA